MSDAGLPGDSNWLGMNQQAANPQLRNLLLAQMLMRQGQQSQGGMQTPWSSLAGAGGNVANALMMQRMFNPQQPTAQQHSPMFSDPAPTLSNPMLPGAAQLPPTSVSGPMGGPGGALANISGTGPGLSGGMRTGPGYYGGPGAQFPGGSTMPGTSPMTPPMTPGTTPPMPPQSAPPFGSFGSPGAINIGMPSFGGGIMPFGSGGGGFRP